MKSESKFKVKFLKALREIPHTWGTKIQQVSISGTPDILACVNGQFVAIELKATAKDKTSGLQDYELNCINEAHGHSFICYPENFDDVIEDIRKLSYGILSG